MQVILALFLVLLILSIFSFLQLAALDFAFILCVLGALGGSKQGQGDDCVYLN